MPGAARRTGCPTGSKACNRFWPGAAAEDEPPSATVGNASKVDNVMQNDKGVVLHLISAAKGLAHDLGVEGMKITLE